jgi:hypothetical protein
MNQGCRHPNPTVDPFPSFQPKKRSPAGSRIPDPGSSAELHPKLPTPGRSHPTAMLLETKPSFLHVSG